MKKLFSFFLVFLTLVFVAAPSVSANFDSDAVTSQLDSGVYYMENLEEGTVLFDKDSEKQVPIAGFAKVLAAVVAIEKWGNLDGEIKLTEENLNVFEYEMGMLTALYEEGEIVSKKELFDCLVIYSANDALSIIAHDVAGTEENFIAEMQNLVKKIGCTSTVIKNIHGFDTEGQYTTARDVSKIIKYAVNYPAFTEAFALDEITLKETDYNEKRTCFGSNQMLNPAVADYYHSSVTGGRQTSTDLAGECIAVVSNADGYSYLTVVMDGKYDDIDDDGYDENTSMTDAQKMLDWVYENIRFKVVATVEQVVSTVDVIAGKGDEKLQLVPEKEISALVPLSAGPASVMFEVVDGQDKESVIAPVKAGDVIAQANIYYAGHKLKTVNLVAKNDIKLSFGGLVITAAKAVFGSVFFIIIAFIAAFIACLKFALDLKDYFDKERRKSYDPLPSSFEVLTEKIKKKIAFAGKSKKGKPTKKKAPSEKGYGSGEKSEAKAKQKTNANTGAKTGTKPKTGAKPSVQKTSSTQGGAGMKKAPGAKKTPVRKDSATKNRKVTDKPSQSKSTKEIKK